MNNRWVLLKRRGCKPCEKMESYLRFRLEQVPDAFCAIDVDADETLKQAYGLRVPVLLHLDQVISEGKWEIERIEESLKQAGY